jgi:sodium transport system ATP-binding protein
MIEIKNLTKVYKLNKKQMKESKTKSNRKVAVDHLSLNAHKGNIWSIGSERCREDDDTSLHCNDY